MNKLRYQAAFIKDDPPFRYNGEVQASTFKKWCREVRAWAQRGCLSEQAAVELSGKYLGGRAYHFFERDVLDLKRRYTLTEFFEHLFDYVFPPDFRMQQCDKFDVCEQRDQSVLDYLHRLHEIADTIGDLSERDIVIAFWRRCKAYLRFEMSKEGTDPSQVSLVALERAALRHERAHRFAEEESRHSRKTPSRQDNPPYNSRNSNSQAPGVNRKSQSEFQTSRASNPQRSGGNSGEKQSGPNSNRPSSKKEVERRNRLRSKGKCFQCESKDHLAKDCPERNSKRPPLGLRSMGLASPVEVQLAAMQEGHELGLFGVGVVSTDDFPADQEVTLDDLQGEIRQRLLKILYSSVSLALDYKQPDAEYSPFMVDHFEINDSDCVPTRLCGLGCLMLLDQHSSTEYEVSYEDLLLPDFDIIQWLHTQKAVHFDELLRAKRVHKWTGPLNIFTALGRSPDDDSNDSDDSDDKSDNGEDWYFIRKPTTSTSNGDPGEGQVTDSDTTTLCSGLVGPSTMMTLDSLVISDPRTLVDSESNYQLTLYQIGGGTENQWLERSVSPAAQRDTTRFGSEISNRDGEGQRTCVSGTIG